MKSLLVFLLVLLSFTGCTKEVGFSKAESPPLLDDPITYVTNQRHFTIYADPTLDLHWKGAFAQAITVWNDNFRDIMYFEMTPKLNYTTIIKPDGNINEVAISDYPDATLKVGDQILINTKEEVTDDVKYTVALHELAHILGLKHIRSRLSFLNPDYPFRQEFTPEDKQLIINTFN